MDRNFNTVQIKIVKMHVALRKESVDRNLHSKNGHNVNRESLSARRAWIEIEAPSSAPYAGLVALRKESVDRNL